MADYDARKSNNFTQPRCELNLSKYNNDHLEDIFAVSIRYVELRTMQNRSLIWLLMDLLVHENISQQAINIVREAIDSVLKKIHTESYNASK